MTDTSTEPKNALPGEMGTMALAAATRELESDVARLRKQLKKLRVAATPRRDGPRRGRRLPAPGRGRFVLPRAYARITPPERRHDRASTASIGR